MNNHNQNQNQQHSQNQVPPSQVQQNQQAPQQVNSAEPVNLLPRTAPVQKGPQPLSGERRKELTELTIPGVVDRPINNLSFTDEALLTKEKLSKEEKVSVFLQLDPGEKRGAYRSVTINGYRIEVQKAKQQKLPKSVVALLMDAYAIEADTLNNAETNLANADEDKRKALGL